VRELDAEEIAKGTKWWVIWIWGAVVAISVAKRQNMLEDGRAGTEYRNTWQDTHWSAERN
jgi:hypothetical protein